MTGRRAWSRRTLRGADDDLIDAATVAGELAVGSPTVLRWCRSGRLRCVKLGRGWRVRRGDLEAFVRGAQAPRTLVDHLAGFLAVPDQVLVLAEDHALLRRIDAAILAAGARSGGRLVRVYDPGAVARQALAATYREHGLDVDVLEGEGRLTWVAEPDPAVAAARLGDALTAPQNGWAATWAVCDLDRLAGVGTALAHLQAARSLVAAHPLVVATGVVEPESAQWPPPAQQWALLAAVRGTVRAARGGLQLARTLPLPEAEPHRPDHPS